MSKHDKFILTPITSVLNEAVVASYGIGKGIESYTISDYFLQSLFLKMTGFQEQKMKCIAWEMATNDFNYRRILLNNDDSLGEYSSYNAKNAILKRFQDMLGGIQESFKFDNFFGERKKLEIQGKVIKDTVDILKNTNLVTWKEREFNYFSACGEEIIKVNQFLPQKQNKQKYYQLFQNELKEKYEILYTQRNRLAHNVLSYQDNLPTLQTLEKENEESRNYFVWFAILVLIDEIFMELFKKYKDLLDGAIY
ncbi:hypothetical protein [Streptococcus ruminantium]|uniref:hypothetical protein n=1 Tax=Streptococcus ruminantium TaxID=1917441 RepID=UPI0012DFE32F|nr:hypothetical protein [Streptococcus ruminantium]